jgi:hypothetical protein
MPERVTTCSLGTSIETVYQTRGAFMVKLRTARVLYFLGVVAAFVIAAGADRKFG